MGRIDPLTAIMVAFFVAAFGSIAWAVASDLYDQHASYKCQVSGHTDGAYTSPFFQHRCKPTKEK